jgi:hypothetical protein
VHDDNVVLVDLTNPDIYFGKSLLRSKDAIHIIRAHRRLGARNFGEQGVDLNFSFPSLMISTICSRWAECDARRAASLKLSAYVRNWQCAPKARIISGGRFHPESCRLIWKLTSGSAG